MSKIFADDSDAELNFKTDNEYAKNYDKWRKKEEINKLKTKYQNEFDSEDSSTESEDDEEGIEITEKVEKDFFKTLACLKNKDPRIYDENVRFFDDYGNNQETQKKSEKNAKSVYLKDYERNLILEKGGILSDEDDDNSDNKNHSTTYVEEQQQAKEKLKKALNSIEDKNEENWGGIFTKREKTLTEKEKEEADYKKWLAGQKDEIDDHQIGKELKPLKEFWNDPNLDKGEQFLRDYILKKQFLDQEDEDYIPTYDEIVHDSDELSDDERILEKQEEFEHKYNFRFEEPDQEFIKRFPRTMENSLRKKDDKRKQKRQEIKERKKKEKEVKMQDLKKLQDLKRKEIEEKIEKLKEITGNTTLSFADEDIEEEFDPDKYDKRMQELFNDDFYQGPEGDKKPEFPDLDEELEIENWSHFYKDEGNETVDSSVHCEDENFNMDCDYDPTATQNELIENTKNKKKRKRKSKFAEAVGKQKPKFDPNDKTYEEYFEEYYKLDCEDFIGDIPCRFKYRKVIPNDFGLGIEEILMAKERELNKWCSLKKAIQIRPDHVEKYDQIAYNKKAQNIALKKKILPSLFTSEENVHNSQDSSIVYKQNIENPKIDIQNKKEDKAINNIINADDNTNKKDNKKQIKNSENMLINDEDASTKIFKTEIEHKSENDNQEEKSLIKTYNNANQKAANKKKRKKRKMFPDSKSENILDKDKQNNDELELTNMLNKDEPSKKKHKADKNLQLSKDKSMKISSIEIKKQKKKQKQNKDVLSIIGQKGGEQIFKQKQIQTPSDKVKIKKRNSINESPLAKISDERLSAYGIKKKKFKNKLKYKK